MPRLHAEALADMFYFQSSMNAEEYKNMGVSARVFVVRGRGRRNELGQITLEGCDGARKVLLIY